MVNKYTKNKKKIDHIMCFLSLFCLFEAPLACAARQKGDYDCLAWLKCQPLDFPNMYFIAVPEHYSGKKKKGKKKKKKSLG